MTDRVLLSASPTNIWDCIQLATERGMGLELMAFAYPELLDGDWRAAVAAYRVMLQPVRGVLAMHGPFLDMAPGSPDQQINEVVSNRYRHAIRIAQELGVSLINFHANFIASIHSESYRRGWQERNISFWSEIAEYASQRGVMVVVENMWEFDPDIIGDVLKAVDHPNLRACLDVGHARLFSQLPFERWLETLRPWLIHVHLNNNDGRLDLHSNLKHGVIEYAPVLAALRETCAPTMTLEMDRVEDMRVSLPFFELPALDEAENGDIPVAARTGGDGVNG